METFTTTFSAEHCISIKPIDRLLPHQPRPEAFEIIWLKNQTPPEPAGDRSENNGFRSRGRAATRRGDCLYLLPPGKEYPLNWFGQEGVLIRFHQDLLHYEVNEFSIEVNQLFTQQENFSVLFVESPLSSTLDRVYQLLKEEYIGKRNFLLLRTLLKVFLLKLVEQQSQQFVEQDFNQKRVHQFQQLLEQHYKEETSVTFYADRLNITSKRLNQILKQKIHRTIRQCLHERLVAEAKHQLILSKLTIKEIATELGFDDHSYFSRFFKKMTGLTPEAYQKKAQARIALTAKG